MGCATTTGAIQFSGQHYKKTRNSWFNNGKYAIFIDDEFVYEDKDFFKDLPIGNHHIIVKHPNQILMDTTVYVTNKWSIKKSSNTILTSIISTGLIFIPLPSILPYVISPIPVIIANLSSKDGAIPLNIKTGPDPILTKTDSAIGIKISHNTEQTFSITNISDYYPAYLGIMKTNEFCLDKNAPNEPLIWFFTKEAEPMLYAIPRKHVTICKSAEPFSNDCGPEYEAILEEHLCPQL